MKQCTHLNQIHDVTPSTDGCEECLKMGDTRVHLRLCMTCGHVGCCDSSKNKHATKHFHRVKHPIMRSIEPGENWGWCYIDQLELLLEQYGATENASRVRMLLKNMVGPWGLEPQTSTVSTRGHQVLTTTYKAVGDCQVLDNTQ
jgi:hypothetical protein